MNKMKAELMTKIKGFDKYYISKNGEILCVNYMKTNKCKLLKKQSTLEGYHFVQLSKNGKIFNKRINRLVAETFIPNPDNLPQVNHIDEDKTNNKVNNLEWCTAKYNNCYGSRLKKMAKTKSKRVLGYNKDGVLIYLFDKIKDSGKYGFCEGHISSCCNGKRNSHKNIIWKFADNKEDNKDNEE